MMDVWTELYNSQESEPIITLCCQDANGNKKALLNLSIAAATRLNIILTEYLRFCSNPSEEYVQEQNG